MCELKITFLSYFSCFHSFRYFLSWLSLFVLLFQLHRPTTSHLDSLITWFFQYFSTYKHTLFNNVYPFFVFSTPISCSIAFHLFDVRFPFVMWFVSLWCKLWSQHASPSTFFPVLHLSFKIFFLKSTTPLPVQQIPEVIPCTQGSPINRKCWRAPLRAATLLCVWNRSQVLMHTVLAPKGRKWEWWFLNGTYLPSFPLFCGRQQRQRKADPRLLQIEREFFLKHSVTTVDVVVVAVDAFQCDDSPYQWLPGRDVRPMCLSVCSEWKHNQQSCQTNVIDNGGQDLQDDTTQNNKNTSVVVFPL